MAQSGYTPILIYGSGTPGNTPSAGNLTSSSAGAELAINYADGKLYYKDSGGAVQVIATKGAGTIGGSNTQVQFNNSGALAGSANLTFDGTKLTAAGLNVSGLTASTALALDASKNVVSVTNTGTGNNVLATSPVLTTPNLGTPSALTLTNATGLPIAGITGLGTGVGTALAVNVGSAGAVVLNGGALGTPSSGTVTNLTGTASININGTVGATTPNTGAFTTLSASGVATFSAGTAAAPALTTIGDTDTGVFFPAANTWAVATGGVQALAVDSAGGLSVRGSATLGSTTIAGNTQVNLASGTTDYTSLTRYSTGLGEIRHFGTAAFQLVTHNAADILFYANNSERMRITSAGNVGVGVNTPAYLFDVANGFTRIGAFNTQSFPASENSLGGAVFGWNRSAGSAQVTITNVYDNAPLSFEFAQKTGASTANVLYAFGNSNHLWYTGGSERMRIDSSGNVGIGTTTPAVRLDVAEADTSQIRAVATTNGVDTRLLSQGLSANAGVVGTYSNHPLVVFANSQERMRIAASGNVGIGTNNPAVKLEVAGQIRTEAPTGGTAANWRLGTVHTVSPTSPNRTIEVDIGGTIYYLHAKTTND